MECQTEDQVRDKVRQLLDFTDSDTAQCGVEQITLTYCLSLLG